MKQTAVEWFKQQIDIHIDQFSSMPDYDGLKHLISKTKEMEKEQIESAFRNGVFPTDYFDPENPQIEPPQLYYNETYGK